MRKILFVLLCSLLTAQVFGYSFKDEDSGLCFNITRDWEQPYTVEVTCENSDNYYAINYIRLTTAIIPETVSYSGETYTVTSIGSSAFENCTNLTSVTIPNSVTSIGWSAFSGCNGLTSVTIPNSVTSIGSSAFYGCSGLTSVTIPNSVTSIGSSAFSGCSGLTSVTIPNSVTSIGNSTFYGCSNLTSVTIPNSVMSIGNSTFSGCSGLTSVTIPNSVMSIGSDAFYNCSGLTSVIIPNSVTRIGSNAFYSVNTIIYGGSATDVGSWSSNWGAGKRYYAFDENFAYSNTEKTIITEYLGQGTEVVIPNGVTEIGSYVFQNCTNLTSVSIPNSVTSIGEWAFYNCSGLTSVTIPNSVMSIGESAFYNCSGLTSVIIPNSVTSIGSGTFYNCSGLTSVTIPNSVTSIGSYAFSGCSGLTSVIIPNSVTEIGTDAFYNCSGLSSVNFAENSQLTSIGGYAFYNCSGLTSVIIPNSVTEIGTDAFYSVNTIIYGGSATDEGSWSSNWGAGKRYYAFDENFAYSNTEKTIITEYLGQGTEVVIPNGVTEIGSSVFQNCTNLTSVSIPNSVTSIGSQAFYNCSGLASVNFAEDSRLTSIGNSAFYGCSGLTSVTIPNSVTSIGSGTFYNCSGLTSVDIPNVVTYIGSNAFHKVNNINYNGSATGRPWGANRINGVVYEYPMSGFLTDNHGDLEETNDYLRLIVQGTFGDCWDAQVVTPSWGGLDGQKEGASFCLSFDYKCTAEWYENGYIRIASGKTYPYDPNYNQGSNTQIVDDRGTPVVYAENQPVTTEWQHYDYDYYIGAEGEDSIRLEIDCGAAGGDVYFKNFVLKIDGKVVAKYYCTETLVKNNITYILDEDGTATVGSSNASGAVTIDGTVSKNGKTYTVTDINSNAFQNCSGITSVTIPNSVMSIGSSAFYNCSGLSSVNFAEDSRLTSIGNSAFYGCSGLTSVTIPNSVTSIGSGTFYNCSGLSSVTIPNSVTSIGSQVFEKCRGLISITIPESVTSIGSSAFYNCSGLSSVNFAEDSRLTSIGNSAFYGCSGLISITIPESVTSIDDAAFSGCVNMTKITCNSFMPPVADRAFERSYEFYNKVTLTYPGEAYNLYSKMEPWCFFNVDTNAQGERVLYINRNDTVTYLDTVFVFNNDTIHSITHDTIVVVNQSITHDTTYVVSKDTVYVIGSTAKTYKVTSTTTNSVMGIGIGTGMYEENSQVELVAIANYGYHFTKWSDGNTNNPRFEKVTADCNYYAEFGVNNYSVMASSNNIKMGYVEGSDDYAYLSKTQLRAVPKYGYKFTGWSDGETVNPREVLVYCDTTFTALFMANDETDIDGETANGVVVYAHHNVIVVENATADIYVYDTMGRLVARRDIACNVSIAMPREGIYIVKCGGDVKRIYLGFRN